VKPGSGLAFGLAQGLDGLVEEAGGQVPHLGSLLKQQDCGHGLPRDPDGDEDAGAFQHHRERLVEAVPPEQDGSQLQAGESRLVLQAGFLEPLLHLPQRHLGAVEFLKANEDVAFQPADLQLVDPAADAEPALSHLPERPPSLAEAATVHQESSLRL
jgi:hypothetical protein